MLSTYIIEHLARKKNAIQVIRYLDNKEVAQELNMNRRQFLQCVCSVVVGIAIHDFKSKDESCEDDEVEPP
jgi:hypothetical protein